MKKKNSVSPSLKYHQETCSTLDFACWYSKVFLSDIRAFLDPIYNFPTRNFFQHNRVFIVFNLSQENDQESYTAITL